MRIFLSPTGFCAAGKRCCSRSAGGCPLRSLICLNQDLQDLQDLQDEELFALTRLW